MAGKEFFVIDGDGFVSSVPGEWRESEPEAFGNLRSATKRARELAQSEPGRTVVITQAVSYVTCPEPPKTRPQIVMRKL
jgi:hypothetical protein